MTIELATDNLSPEEQWKAEQASTQLFNQHYPDIPIVNVENIGEVISSLHETEEMDPNRPYNGQSHTHHGVRGQAEVKGLTMRDIRDCFIRAFIISHSYHVYDEAKREYTLIRQEPNATLIDEANKGIHAKINDNDIYNLVGDIDPIAVSQNLTCEIEKMMGIFPNLPRTVLIDKISEPDQSPNPPCDGCQLKVCDDKSSY